MLVIQPCIYIMMYYSLILTSCMLIPCMPTMMDDITYPRQCAMVIECVLDNVCLHASSAVYMHAKCNPVFTLVHV